MDDTTLTALADLLVGYSTDVQPGDVVAIEGDVGGAALMLAIYRAVLLSGGLPTIHAALDGQEQMLLELGAGPQLDWVPPPTLWSATSADVRIHVDAPTARAVGIPTESRARRLRSLDALSHAIMERTTSGDLRAVRTLVPTPGLARQAGLSLDDYEQVFASACFLSSEDPGRRWRRFAKDAEKMATWLDNRDEIHLLGDGTDLKLSIAGRTTSVGAGKGNMPDGEVYTSPIEDSAQGFITFSLPTVYDDEEFSGVRLAFRDGLCVDATATHGEGHLLELLDLDEGSRRLGEIGFGCNFDVTRSTRCILIDEKIGGTVHLALGQSYIETGGCNSSGLHLDLICDLRSGGTVTADKRPLLKAGRLVPDMASPD